MADDQRPEIACALDRLAPEARATTIATLDALTRPLSAREIEQRLAGHLSHKQRKVLVAALRGLAIIVIAEGGAK